MNTQEKWNFIVERHKTNFSKPENVVQKEWEDIFSELFDYKKLLGEIVSQKQIHIGSSDRTIPDILLGKDGVEIVDVELKQYNLPLKENFENQLKSYLTLTHTSIGVIVCNKLYLFWFDYESSASIKIEIPFEKDNERGIKFVELFNKNVINKNVVKKFIFSEKEKECETVRARNLLTSEFVRECVVEKLIKDFNQDVANEVMSDFYFDVKTSVQNVSNIEESKETRKIGDDNYCYESNDFPETNDFIIIKTSEQQVLICNGSLYDATRHAWNVSYNSVIQYPYVLSVINGIVKEVYKVKNWYPATQWKCDNKDISSRYEFVGEIAPEIIREKWLGKLIPAHYRKKGMASPVVYSKTY